MTRVLERLSSLQVRRFTKLGLHADGRGLNLQITGQGGRSWVFRYQKNSKERLTGLGSVYTVSLAEARRQRAAGPNPIDQRRKAQAAVVREDAKSITFDDAIDAVEQGRDDGDRKDSED